MINDEIAAQKAVAATFPVRHRRTTRGHPRLRRTATRRL